MKNTYFYFGSGFIALSFYFFYKVYDRMVNYDNPEYPTSNDDLVNVHVGGDAYNYIINGTHATVFAVIAIGLMLAALICFIYQSYIDRHNSDNLEETHKSKEEYVNPNPAAEAFVQEYRQRNAEQEQQQEQPFKRSKKD